MRTLKHRTAIAGALIATALLWAGCGKSGVPRYNLSGTVTYQGKPVPAGQIIFEPDGRKGNDGPQGFSDIKDGKYGTDKFGKGAVAGPLIVTITGTTGKNPTEANMLGQPLFPKYETTIDLPEEAIEYDFEVPVRR